MVQNVFLTSYWMGHYVFFHMVLYVSRMMVGNVTVVCWSFFSFSLYCSLNYMEVFLVYGGFISIFALLIVLFGLDFCCKNFDLFQFFSSIEIVYIFFVFILSPYSFNFRFRFKSINIFGIKVWIFFSILSCNWNWSYICFSFWPLLF